MLTTIDASQQQQQQRVMITITFAAALVIPFAICFLLQCRRRRRQWHHHHSNVQLPPVLPLGWIETTLQVSSSNAPWFLLKWARQIGFVYRIRIPYLNHVVVVGDVDLAKEILNDPTTAKPFSFYGAIDIAAGASNIFTANGERWRHARKATALAFSSTHLQRMNRVCHDKLEEWIQRRLNVVCDADQTFDPAQEMLLLSLSIICEAAFEYQMDPDDAALFVQESSLAVKEYVLAQGNNPIRATWLGYLFAYTEIRRAEQATRTIQTMTQKILDQYYKTNASPNNGNSGTVIERIVQNSNYKNDRERVADMIVFLVAGHDTTAYSIAWTMLEMARHPNEVQEARRQLQQEELQSAAAEDNKERLKSTTALDNLIKEVMRLRPVAALGAVRETHRDFVWNSNKDNNTDSNDTLSSTSTTTMTTSRMIIPKGSVVITPVFLIHRNPQYFDRPDEFIPDRWNNNDKDTTTTTTTPHTTTTTNNNNNNAFIPFVTGAHNCVGQALAMAELRTVLTRLTMDYEFIVDNPGKADFGLTLKPSGVRLKAKRL